MSRSWSIVRFWAAVQSEQERAKRRASRVGWLGYAVEPGEMLPRWYGHAYWSPAHPWGVAYPIPLNAVVRAAHLLRGWAKRGFWPVTSGETMQRRIERDVERRVLDRIGTETGWVRV